MNCEFCGDKEAKHRCPSCGTCVCEKHTDKRIGSKIFGGFFLLLPGFIGAQLAAPYMETNDPWIVGGLALAIAGGLAELIYGQGCLKCKERLKEL